MNNNCNDNYDRIKKKIEEERERCNIVISKDQEGRKVKEEREDPLL